MNELHHECACAALTPTAAPSTTASPASASRLTAVTCGNGKRLRPTAISASTASTIPKTTPAWTRAACVCPSEVIPSSAKATASAPAAGSPAAISVESASIQAWESSIQRATTTIATSTPPRENVSPITTIQPNTSSVPAVRRFAARQRPIGRAMSPSSASPFQ